MAEDKKQEEIVISLDSLGVPIAIVIAGIIIAGGIFFMNKSNAKVDNTATDNAKVAGEEDNTADTSGTDQYAQYTTDGKSVSIDDDPYVGDKSKAKVAMVEFSDYQCSYCGRHASQVFPSILEKKVNTGEIIYVFRDYQMFGEISETTAKVGEYIADSSIDKFVEFHEGAFSLKSVDAVYSLAAGLGFKIDDLKAYVATKEASDELAKDFSDGQAAGVSGTPAFVIGVLDENGNVNGKFISGALPYEAFEAVINEMLAK